VDGADARAGQHGHDGLGDERHIDGHAVAGGDAETLQDIGELRDLGVELLVGIGADVARFTFPDDGLFVAARGEMPVEAVVRSVDLPAHEPLRVGGFHSRIVSHFVSQSSCCAHDAQ